MQLLLVVTSSKETIAYRTFSKIATSWYMILTRSVAELISHLIYDTCPLTGTVEKVRGSSNGRYSSKRYLVRILGNKISRPKSQTWVMQRNPPQGAFLCLAKSNETFYALTSSLWMFHYPRRHLKLSTLLNTAPPVKRIVVRRMSDTRMGRWKYFLPLV